MIYYYCRSLLAFSFSFFVLLMYFTCIGYKFLHLIRNLQYRGIYCIQEASLNVFLPLLFSYRSTIKPLLARKHVFKAPTYEKKITVFRDLVKPFLS